MRTSCCVSVCIYVSPLKLLNAWINQYGTWYALHIMAPGPISKAYLKNPSRHLISINQSNNLLIPTLQSLKLLRKNLSVTWIPKLIAIKLGRYIMPLEPISKACFFIPLITNTNITVSQIVAVVTLLLLNDWTSLHEALDVTHATRVHLNSIINKFL
jgi:hypothetical protein